MDAPIDHGRDPCPWRIVDDMGGAFAMGAIGGAIWHAFKGAQNSPRGERLVGSLSAVKARAPILGGNFAVWGGMFGAFDCTLAAIRQKEDPWNSILSGAMTGGCLAIRGGPKAALMSAAFGGVILSMIEGLGIAVSRMSSDSYKPARPVEPPVMLPPSPPVAPPSNHSSSPSYENSFEQQGQTEQGAYSL